MREKVECPVCGYVGWEEYFEDNYAFTCPICGAMFE